MRTFGVEASIEDLRVSSGYSQDAIWLFSVELLHHEMRKFDGKAKSAAAEQKAAYEKAESKINK